jgi:hypothetical protein
MGGRIEKFAEGDFQIKFTQIKNIKPHFMQKILYTFSLCLLSLLTNAATFRSYVGHTVSGSTYTIWVNSNTVSGEGVFGQICNNGGSPFTGFVDGTFDNTSVPGANWKIVITLNGQTTPRLELGNKNQSGDPYGYTGCNIVMSALLPVELTRFSVKKEGESNKLIWVTASEKDHSHFVVERAGANLNWTALHELQAQGGNSDRTKTYAYTDEKPLSGVNHYRLRIVSEFGAVEYSKSVAVV